MDTQTVVLLISVLIGSAGVSGGIVAWIKVRPEANRITVSAAEGAVIVQTGVIDSLHKELARMEKELQEEREEKRLLAVQLEDYRMRLRKLEDSLRDLRSRTHELELAGSSNLSDTE